MDDRLKFSKDECVHLHYPQRSCMEYIASNPGVMAKELFEELSPELQMEVYDITMWSKAK